MQPMPTHISASGEAFPMPYQHSVGKASTDAFLPTFFPMPFGTSRYPFLTTFHLHRRFLGSGVPPSLVVFLVVKAKQRMISGIVA
uniref:Uncharacterized protein n=1 Tax=Cucumis melo TaxID=3656 RepID=A0A9I9E6Q3_CUCME